MIANVVVQLGNWEVLKFQLIPIRTTVFIEEQRVPEELEWDNVDQSAVHLIASNQQKQCMGCARVSIHSNKNTAYIGRMAVLKTFRHQGVGRLLLQAALEYCLQQNVQIIALSAQTHAIGFYEKAGFKINSDAYMDAGILHVDMVFNRM